MKTQLFHQYASCMLVTALMTGCSSSQHPGPDLAKASIKKFTITAYQPPNSPVIIELRNRDSHAIWTVFTVVWESVDKSLNRRGEKTIHDYAYPNSLHTMEVQETGNVKMRVKITNLGEFKE